MREEYKKVEMERGEEEVMRGQDLSCPLITSGEGRRPIAMIRFTCIAGESIA